MGPIEFFEKATNRARRDLAGLARYLAHERRERQFAANLENLDRGSAPWLIAAERRYGGYVKGIIKNKVSPHDERPADVLRAIRMVGGDRMSARYHNYAVKYAQYLQPLAETGARVVVVEVGILRGSGVAIWSDLFPGGRIIGLDLDLGNIRENLPNLQALGAFKHDNLELHEFDQLADNAELLDSILGGDKITVLIDDGMHSHEAILTTLRSALPHLADDFVVLIEDNATVAPLIAKEFHQFKVDSNGQLSVLTPT